MAGGINALANTLGKTDANGALIVAIDSGSSGIVFSVTGTANQITATTTAGAVVLTIPAVFIAPGSIAATTTVSGTAGTFTTSLISPAWIPSGGTAAVTGILSVSGDITSTATTNTKDIGALGALFRSAYFGTTVEVGNPTAGVWSASYSPLKIGNRGALSATTSASVELQLTNNVYYNGGWKELQNDQNNDLFSMSTGTFKFGYAAAVGTGAAVTFSGVSANVITANQIWFKNFDGTTDTATVKANKLTATAITNAYTVTNVTTDRTYDANATSVDELADVLGTLLADLNTAGLLPS